MEIGARERKWEEDMRALVHLMALHSTLEMAGIADGAAIIRIALPRDFLPPLQMFATFEIVRADIAKPALLLQPVEVAHAHVSG